MPTCKECGSKVGLFELHEGQCWPCRQSAEKRDRATASEADAAAIAATDETDRKAALVILSTEAAPDLRVEQRLDIVTAEFAVGMGLLTDVFNAWRDVFGGRSKSYQNALKDARRAVLLELRREAHSVGADAVLGVSLDYSEISGGGKSMLFLVASGTAVKLAKAP